MSAIRVSGRKNSGINIAGFNSQDGENNAYYCNCYNCCGLIDSSKEKKILSGVIKNSGTSCSTCRTKIAPACWLTKRRCMECHTGNQICPDRGTFLCTVRGTFL